jgi:hypothetical protein
VIGSRDTYIVAKRPTPGRANVAPWLLPHKRFLGHHAEIRVYAWRCGDECREAITMLALGMTSGADE